MINRVWDKIAAWLGFQQWVDDTPEPAQPPLPELIEKPCIVCGNQVPKYKQRYCSELCRKMARRERERKEIV